MGGGEGERRVVCGVCTYIILYCVHYWVHFEEKMFLPTEVQNGKQPMPVNEIMLTFLSH